MKTIVVCIVLLLFGGCRVAFTVRHDNLPFTLTVEAKE